MISSRWARTVAKLGIASVLALSLGACGGGGFSLPSLSSSSPAAPEPGLAPDVPATIRSDEIVGKWGLASYQNPADRARTEKQALAQCKQPYVIGAGTAGGVVMHLADQATPQELRLKGSQGGKNYIGPAGPGQWGCKCYVYWPWQRHVDVSLIKITHLRESVTLEIRAQALNVVNSSNFLLGAAANEVNSGGVTASFGQTRSAYRDITVSGSSDPGGRIIEFLVRFKF